jgi:hypothetical protein
LSGLSVVAWINQFSFSLFFSINKSFFFFALQRRRRRRRETKTSEDRYDIRKWSGGDVFFSRSLFLFFSRIHILTTNQLTSSIYIQGFVTHTISFLNIIFISQYFVTLKPHWTETTNQLKRKREGEKPCQ